MSDHKISTARLKPPIALIPLRALFGAARAFAYGVIKYAPGNFLNASLAGDGKEDRGAGERYVSGAMRHLSDMQTPGGLWTPASLATRDAESGVPHIDMAIAGLLMLRSIMIKEAALDADPGEGVAPVAAKSMARPNVGHRVRHTNGAAGLVLERSAGFLSVRLDGAHAMARCGRWDESECEVIP